jgi:hypothetical protein
MWWEHVYDYEKDIARKVIKSKQLEFINGAVSMNDEATTYYEDIIDNLSYGHWWIEQNIGVEFIPSIGWQIDPFGHS